MPTLLASPTNRIDNATRREFLALLGAAGLLTACATPQPPDPSGAATRSYTGGYGPVELPVAPARVATMYATDTDYALVLGLPLAGAFASRGSADSFSPYHADRLVGVAPLVTFPEPDFESIAAVRPDLVLHTAGFYYPEQAEPLSAIAPVLALPEPLQEAGLWRDQLREIAGIVDRTDAAEQFITGYDERAAELRDRVQARWGGATIAYVGPLDPGEFYIAQKDMQTNLTLHSDLGMPHAPVVPATVEERRTDISYEEMGLLVDVDVILLRVNAREGSVEPDREQTAAITGAPLWATLPAARAGSVFEVDADLFYASPLTAEANLDWAEQNLLDEQ